MPTTPPGARAVKIAYIGGGSRAWARMLMSDLALCPRLTGELVLYDIDPEGALDNVVLGQRLFASPESATHFDLRFSKALPEALRGADFVVLSIQPGPISMFASDLDIPLKYGVLQPVGDTTGPGGIMRALRAIPLYVDFAHAIRAHCPHAWVINYTNPMTLCTAALYAAEPEIQAFGCCHEVFGTQDKLAKLVQEHFHAPACNRREIKLDIAGVNHFTFATAASWEGRDLFPVLQAQLAQPGFFADRTAAAKERAAQGKWFDSDGLIAADFLRRFGALGAAGDRHLAEFVPWYLQSEAALHRWGVIATPSSYRLEKYRSGRERHAAPPPAEPVKLKPSGEEGVAQMTALLGLGDLDTNVNLPNRGQLADLPRGAVVETYAQFRRDSATPVVARALPPGLAEIVRRVTGTQQLTLQAALTRDKDLAFQAVLSDALVRLPTDRAREMFDELAAAEKEMLPFGGG